MKEILHITIPSIWKGFAAVCNGVSQQIKLRIVKIGKT